jgi:hypothetical protein
MISNEESIEKIIESIIKTFLYVSFFIGLIIGLIFSYIPKNPIVSILLVIIGSVMQLKFEPVNKIIIKSKNQIIKKHQDILGKNEKKSQLDYLALATDSTKIQDIKSDEYESLKENMTINEFEAYLEKRREYFQFSHKAITGLLSHPNIQDENPQKNYNCIHVMAKHAAKNVIEDDDNSKKIYVLLVKYLNAWLICSIKYQAEELPINLINHRNENIETTIKALKFIKKDITEDVYWQEMMDIPQQSIMIIDEYLEKLISSLSNIPINFKV